MPTKKPKTPTQIESLARSHTESMVNVLAKIATSPKSPAASRVAAALGLMDRGWGKPTQTHAGDEDNPLRFTIVTGVPQRDGDDG